MQPHDHTATSRMRRFVPIMVAVIVMVALAAVVIQKKNNPSKTAHAQSSEIGEFSPVKQCVRPPEFLRHVPIPQPVMIDLSQKRYQGVALLYGRKFSQTFHPKQWEQYEYFSTYTLDAQGNIYLIPTPFISIHPTTFSLQKKLFRLNTKTGKVEIFMNFDDVRPSPNNPYGLNAIAYDCDDHTLWIGTIDKTDYRQQHGTLYHVDPKTKNILQRIDGFDALTLSIMHTVKGKYLLAGSARDQNLYAFAFDGHHGIKPDPIRILELPDPNAHIRKIKVTSPNHLELQTIPFSYSLIAQSAEKDRVYYDAQWLPKKHTWKISQPSEKR